MSEVADIIARAQALVFDFDGTLVDSNPIKWRAFERCFSGFPDQLAEIMVYCRGYNHAPRWEKFRHVYENILRCAYTPEIEAALLRRFAEETTRQIIEAPEIPGASRFLSIVASRHIVVLLSSTPHGPLLHILQERGWRDYFNVIQGAPVDKVAWLNGFRAEHGIEEKGIVVFGDTPEDAVAARAAGCAFVAVGEGGPISNESCCLSDFTRLSFINAS